MQYITLGRTGLKVSRTAFGALPIQRVDMAKAESILRKAVEGGINFFDTARGYSNSEEKMGQALSSVRDKILIATKSGAKDRATFFQHVEKSLQNLKTDHVDILQLHNPKNWPDPDAPDGVCRALLEARDKGMTRFIGITSHRRDLALQAARSGLYDTVQFPLSVISSEEDLQLIDVCRENNVGVIAMKALCGGMLTNIRTAFAFMRQFDNVVPIWGIQREEELDEFFALEADPPRLDDPMRAAMQKERTELGDDFCRACGYCLPCPENIPIPQAARMKYMLGRMPYKNLLSEKWQAEMKKIESCRECGQCRERCPYHLDVPRLLKKMYAEYNQFLAEHT